MGIARNVIAEHIHSVQCKLREESATRGIGILTKDESRTPNDVFRRTKIRNSEAIRKVLAENTPQLVTDQQDNLWESQISPFLAYFSPFLKGTYSQNINYLPQKNYYIF